MPPPPNTTRQVRGNIKLYAGVILYQESWCLARCLNSLKSFDKVIVADGRPPYTDGPEYSTDGSREICAQYPNVQLVNAPNQTVAGKKNLIQQSIHTQNVTLLFVDPDCHIVGDLESLRHTTIQGVADIPVYLQSWHRHPELNNTVVWRAWCLNPYHMYVPPWSHGTYVRHGKIIPTTKRLSGVAIIHDDAGRPQQLQSSRTHLINTQESIEDYHTKASIISRGLAKIRRWWHGPKIPHPNDIHQLELHI